jgi:hypothetical protein
MRGGVTFFPLHKNSGYSTRNRSHLFPLPSPSRQRTSSYRLQATHLQKSSATFVSSALIPRFSAPVTHPTPETAHDEPLAPRLTWIPHLRISGDRRGELGHNGLGKPVVDWSGRVRGHVCAHRPSLATQALNEPREPIVDPDEAHPGIPLSQISPTLPYGRGGDSFG